MKKNRKNMNFITKVWKLLAPFHKAIYQIGVLTAVFELIKIAVPYIFGKILDLLIKSEGKLTWEAAFYVIGGLVGIRIIGLFLDYFIDILIVVMLWNTEKFISTASFSKMLELSIDYHEKENTGAKINLVNKGKEKLVQLLESFSWEFMPVVLQIIFTSITIFFISITAGLVFVVSIVPFVFITFKTYQSTQKLRSKRHDAYETSSGEVGDILSNITVVKAFAQEQREEKSFKGIWDLIRSLSSREFRTHMVLGFGRSVLIEIFYLGLLIMGIFQIQNGLLTVGSLVFLINLIERAYSNVYRLGRIYERIVDASEPVDRLTILMQKEATVKNQPNAIKPKEIRGQISFKHLTFAYNKRRVLKNVSFTIPAGSFTAFVGKSGSGKSTIAKLISRYYDPTKGSIVIDGKYDLKEIDLDIFRRETAVVFQDSPVPSRKIWEVISYSAGKQTWAAVKNRVIRAAKLSHCDEFIDELDDKYQTEIGERGVKLSGGQRQRLAIARALFAEPKILVMDEPTSHLDTVSEAQIQEALRDISKERALTKIVIAHRLSTVQHADQILVMDKGKLIERGTHKQLLAKNGYYATIVHQSELKG
ncbi:MAG: ABC transporter ATP-binding protein [Microgenomates group bacterium]